MTARSPRRALPRFAALAAATAALVTFGFASPGHAAESGGEAPAATEDSSKAAEGGEAKAEEGHGGEGKKAEGPGTAGFEVTPPTVVNIDGDSSTYGIVGAIGAVTLVGLAAAIASDRRRDAAAPVGGGHH